MPKKLAVLNLKDHPVNYPSEDENWWETGRPVIGEKYLNDAEVYLKDKIAGVQERKEGNTIFHLRDLMSEACEHKALFFSSRGELRLDVSWFKELFLRKAGFSGKWDDIKIPHDKIDEACKMVKNCDGKMSDVYDVWCKLYKPKIYTR